MPKKTESKTNLKHANSAESKRLDSKKKDSRKANSHKADSHKADFHAESKKLASSAKSKAKSKSQHTKKAESKSLDFATTKHAAQDSATKDSATKDSTSKDSSAQAHTIKDSAILPSSVQRAGFVGILGRPNAGKSSLLNHLAGQNLALISHKANATRNKMHFIIPHTTREGIDTQIIFVDTPGIHQREKLLNQFMLEVALKVMKDCDLCVFMASVHDDLSHYEKFLSLYQNALESTAPRKHILVLSKIDTATHEELLSTIDKYNKFSEHFYALIPISTKKPRNINELLEQIAKHLPESSALFDEDDITTHTMREIAKEMIRQSIFSNLSDEIPYESDVILTGFTYKHKRAPLAPKTFAPKTFAPKTFAPKSARQCSITKQIAHISANIYVLKNSQKKIIIGSEGATLKRIGMQARASIEEILGTQVFLRLSVIVDSKWAKNKKNLKNFGYNFEL